MEAQVSEDQKSFGLSSEALRRGRQVCPVCGKRGVGYAEHAHARGFKDYDRARCRYCRKGFVLAKQGAK